MLLPSFQDVHSHLAPGGVSFSDCPVYGLESQEAVLIEIKKCADENPTSEIIRGTGWTIDQFDGGLPP
jgi:hypothetical protein